MKRNTGGGGTAEGSVKLKCKPSSESDLVVYVWFVWGKPIYAAHSKAQKSNAVTEKNCG